VLLVCVLTFLLVASLSVAQPKDDIESLKAPKPIRAVPVHAFNKDTDLEVRATAFSPDSTEEAKAYLRRLQRLSGWDRGRRFWLA
jgi:hypothetical protein